MTDVPTPPVNPQAAPAAAEQPVLRLAARGLAASERLLLEGLVRMSRRDTRRRMQPLELVAEDEVAEADLLLVDGRDAAAVQWARQQPWLAAKPVIWIDAAAAPPGHTLTRRPVQWPVLPILLARAIENHAAPVGDSAPTPAPTAAPVAAAKPTATAQPRPAVPHRIRPHVLVVDDSPLARVQIRSLLNGHGMDVAEADDVCSALQLLRSGTFDAVLMDVLMPGTDGYDGCRQVKAFARGRSQPLPVVMLTSKASPFDRIRGKMAGCDAYLAKPVDPEELHDVLRRHLPDHAAANPLTLSVATSAAATSALSTAAPTAPRPARFPVSLSQPA